MALYMMEKHGTIKNGEVEIYILTWEKIKCIKGLNGLPQQLSSKESSRNAGDVGLIPGLGRSPGGGHGNPLE